MYDSKYIYFLELESMCDLKDDYSCDVNQCTNNNMIILFKNTLCFRAHSGDF